MPRTKLRPSLVYGGLSLLLLVLILVSFTLGAFPVSITATLRACWHKLFPFFELGLPAEVGVVLFNIRLPRLLLAVAVGSALAVAGAVFQNVFRNPLVSPDVLGASSGAAFGAALAILLGFSGAGITLLSFLFGLSSILIVLLLARRLRSRQTLGLLLCGLMVSALFSAALSLLKFKADIYNELPAITYWLMGSLAGSRQSDLLFALPLILLAEVASYFLRWQLNTIALDEDSARSLGVNTTALRLLFILLATLLTAVSVSLCGLVAWVGLIVPHCSALLMGRNQRYALPTTALLGAIFLLLVDDCARLLSSTEIPLAVLTAFVGAPIFLHLLWRESRI